MCIGDSAQLLEMPDGDTHYGHFAKAVHLNPEKIMLLLCVRIDLLATLTIFSLAACGLPSDPQRNHINNARPHFERTTVVLAVGFAAQRPKARSTRTRIRGISSATLQDVCCTVLAA